MRTTPDYGEGGTIGWLRPPTTVIKWLLILNGLAFLLLLLVARLGDGRFLLDYFALSSGGLRSWRLWQLVSYMFLHGGIAHIVVNLLFLWMFGADVEDELGSRKFLKLYLAGGIVGGLVWMAFNLGVKSFLVGASAGVLAVCIAFATLYPERPVTMIVFWFLPVTMKARYWAWLAIAMVAAGCLAVFSNVADLAHLGGIIVGYLYVKWLGYGEMPRWMAAIQRRLPAGQNRVPDEWEAYDSSRPGVAFNHPYRVETEAKSPRTKKLFGLWKTKQEKPKRAQRALSKEEFMSREVDPILDKISKQGMASLTPRERQILQEAGKKMSERA